MRKRLMELGGGVGAASPAVCDPRPSFCSVGASSFPLGASPLLAWNFFIALTVSSSHLPDGVPVKAPFDAKASWISLMRSGVGASWPLTFFVLLRLAVLECADLEDVFVAEPVLFAPLEVATGFLAVVLVDECVVECVAVLAFLCGVELLRGVVASCERGAATAGKLPVPAVIAASISIPKLPLQSR